MPNLPEEIADLITSSVTKAGSEPAEPAEGEVTKGEVGVGKRQTFKYAFANAEKEIIEAVLKHDLGTRWVNSVVYNAATGAPVTPQFVAVSSTEATVNVEGKKGDVVVVVLTA
jgi:hypothetical protein